MILYPWCIIKKIWNCKLLNHLAWYNDIFTKRLVKWATYTIVIPKFLAYCLHDIEPNSYFLNQKRKPKLNDTELIALNLAAECLGIDSERFLFTLLPQSLKAKIDRTVYNRRRRKLAFKIELLRQKIASIIVPIEDYHVIDSMPLEVCKYSRSSRTKICQENIDNLNSV